MTTTEDILDEGAAFTLLHAMRRRFGWVGVEFCRGDIEGLIEETEFDGPTPTPEQIMDSWEWRKMGDILATEGNEALANAIGEFDGEEGIS